MNKSDKGLMNNLDRKYQELLSEIINYGVEKRDRTGTGTISIFGKQFKHNMWEGFPLLTTKKMAWKSIVTELLWFLRGDTNIQYLVENGCHIWDGDAYQNYLKNSSTSLDGMYLSKEEFIHHIKENKQWGSKWGELGPIYGKQWRSWKSYRKLPKDDYTTDYREDDPIDQIQNLISELKTNPDSRRLMVNSWNVGELDKMVLPPCHYGFQIYTAKIPHHNRERLLRERMGETRYQSAVDDCVPFGGGLSEYYDSYKIPERTISLMWNQRSVDTFLGLPFNIASYGLLLEIIAREVNMIPDQLIGNLGDVHLYKNHIEQAKEQIGREPLGLPKLKFSPIQLANFEHRIDTFSDRIKESQPYQFIIEEYKSHPGIKAPLSN